MHLALTLVLFGIKTNSPRVVFFHFGFFFCIKLKQLKVFDSCQVIASQEMENCCCKWAQNLGLVGSHRKSQPKVKQSTDFTVVDDFTKCLTFLLELDLREYCFFINNIFY